MFRISTIGMASAIGFLALFKKIYKYMTALKKTKFCHAEQSEPSPR
jgi:hypothetical protein